MGRRKRILFSSKSVTRMASILMMIIDRHEVGYAVLMGYEEWPTAEELRILKFYKGGQGSDFDIRVRIDNKPSVEERYLYEFTSVENMISFVNKFGGGEKITEAALEYKRAYPDNMQLLKDITTRNISHKTLDEIAADNFIDVKTLRARKEQIIHDIAFYIVYGDRLVELIE